MKLHPESGQIKIMVADWDYDKMRTVRYHDAIQSTFWYLNNVLDVPLKDLQVFDIDSMLGEIVSYYCEMNFDDNDLIQLSNIIELMYAGELQYWNDKIIEATNINKPAQNWSMLGKLM